VSFLFGVYPGGAAGNDAGGLARGVPDDPASVHAALDDLQGPDATPLLVRCYAPFTDAGGPHRTDIAAPARGELYAVNGRRLDLVLLYQSRSGDVEGYAAFVRNAVQRYGAVTRTVQITEEPNVTGNAMLDGDYPDVLRAIAAGVQAARGQASRLGFGHLRIGTNTTPLFGPSAGFYMELVNTGGAALVDGLHYIGLDMFPDVFRAVGDHTIRAATAGLLRHHRRNVLEPAGLGHLPLHITEHGWPTGPERTPDRQASVVREVIETVLEQKDALNIAAYELFSLRDADSGNPDLFHQFGIMTDAYVPKAAYGVFKELLSAGRGVGGTSTSHSRFA
jgi:hypothetical protein